MGTDDRKLRRPKWALLLGRPFGIEVFAHGTLGLLLLWVFSTFLISGSGALQALSTMLLMILVFGIIVLHELGHALVARSFGIRTLRITLLPIGGIAELERLPEKPAQELLVALAGPAVNLVLAALCFLALWLIGGPLDPQALTRADSSVLTRLLWINVSLATFNLLPAFPMDGGRAFRAVLGFWLDRERATEIAGTLGKVMAVLFAIIGLFVAPTLLLIAAFVWMGAGEEVAMMHVKARLEGVHARDVMATRFHWLTPGQTLTAAARLMSTGFQHDFPVLEGSHLLGVLGRADLMRGLTEKGPDSTVEQSMHRRFPTAGPGELLSEVVSRFEDPDCPLISIVEGERLVGLITPEHFADLLTSHVIRQPPVAA